MSIQKSGPRAYLSLATLMIQNATQTLVMRYVRTRQGQMFLSSSAVCMSELVKCFSCLCLILSEEKFSIFGWWSHLKTNIFSDPWDNLKISVPGFLYVVQNNLLYVAASNLEAAKFQVAYQLKLLTTAMFSVIILKKKLSHMQKFSLVLLTLGVALVQEPSSKSHLEKENPWIGFGAVVAACFLSGFSGVYFEKILKNTPQSVVVRNVQLGALGAVLGLLGSLAKDGDAIKTNGFFFGYDVMVWVTIFLLALGGLVVAAVVKYTDNILKGFATSGSIIIASVVSVYLFNFIPTPLFYLGTLFVILSVYLYSKFVIQEPSRLPHSINVED